MWTILEVVSNQVNACRNNTCRDSSSPSLLCIIYNHICLHFLILYLGGSTIFGYWFSMVRKNNEQIRVLIDDCTRAQLWLQQYKKNYTLANASLHSTDVTATFDQCLPDRINELRFIGFFLENTSALTQTVACIKLVPRTICCVVFKVTSTLYPSNIGDSTQWEQILHICLLYYRTFCPI